MVINRDDNKVEENLVVKRAEEVIIYFVKIENILDDAIKRVGIAYIVEMGEKNY